MVTSNLKKPARPNGAPANKARAKVEYVLAKPTEKATRAKPALSTVKTRLGPQSDLRSRWFATCFAILKRWHRQTMAGLDIPHPNFVARFRGEPGLEGEPVYIGSREGAKAALVAGEVNAFVKQLQTV